MSDKRPISEVLQECNASGQSIASEGTLRAARLELIGRATELLAIVEAAKDVVAWPLKQDEPMEHADKRLRDALSSAGEEPTR